MEVNELTTDVGVFALIVIVVAQSVSMSRFEDHDMDGPLLTPRRTDALKWGKSAAGSIACRARVCKVRDRKGEFMTRVYAGLMRTLELQATPWKPKLLARMVLW